MNGWIVGLSQHPKSIWLQFPWSLSSDHKHAFTTRAFLRWGHLWDARRGGWLTHPPSIIGAPPCPSSWSRPWPSCLPSAAVTPPALPVLPAQGGLWVGHLYRTASSSLDWTSLFPPAAVILTSTVFYLKIVTPPGKEVGCGVWAPWAVRGVLLLPYPGATARFAVSCFVSWCWVYINRPCHLIAGWTARKWSSVPSLIPSRQAPCWGPKTHLDPVTCFYPAQGFILSRQVC